MLVPFASRQRTIHLLLKEKKFNPCQFVRKRVSAKAALVQASQACEKFFNFPSRSALPGVWSKHLLDYILYRNLLFIISRENPSGRFTVWYSFGMSHFFWESAPDCKKTRGHSFVQGAGTYICMFSVINFTLFSIFSFMNKYWPIALPKDGLVLIRNKVIPTGFGTNFPPNEKYVELNRKRIIVGKVF